MDSITTMTAKQYRLQQWTEQIHACRNRPAGMSVEEWCGEQGITKATYYYRLRCVREACLEGLRPGEIVPVSRALMAACQEKEKESSQQGGLDLEWNHYTIHVTVDTDPSLLASVLRVIRHAE
mgnify:FL=1